MTKPVEEFYPNVKRGWAPWCKVCHKAYCHKQAKDGYFKKHRAALKAGTKQKKVRPKCTKEERAMTYRLMEQAARRKQHFLFRDMLALLQGFASHNECVFEIGNAFEPCFQLVDHKPTIVYQIEKHLRKKYPESQIQEFFKRKFGSS